MGIVSDFVGGLFKSGAHAADEAADTLARFGGYGIEERRQARDRVTAENRRLLEPFSSVGRRTIGELGDLVNDPEKQRALIVDSPFYGALADDSTRRLFANAAARGKVGSGGTAEALQKSLVLLGDDLLTRDVARKADVAGIGLQATGTQAGLNQNAELGAAGGVADLYTQIGNARAAGIAGAFNIERGTFQKYDDRYYDSAEQASGTGAGVASSIGGAAALSDRRFKTDIHRVGALDDGTPVYTFRYVDAPEEVRMGIMADEAPPEVVRSADGVLYVDYAALTEGIIDAA